jgi:predicted transcriptional regulator
MCFYDQKRFACGDHRWGHFRQHCSKEYRTGETCGMKLVMETHPVQEKCKICVKVDIKRRAIRKEEKRIERWQREGFRHGPIEKVYSNIERLQEEIRDIEKLRLIWDASQSLFLYVSHLL